MSDNPFDNDAWKKQPPPYTPPNYNQPNYNQPNYNQTFPPPGGYQQFPPPPGNFPPYGSNMYGQIDLPTAETARICGIIGLCLCWNLIGIILNIIAIVQGGSALSLYQRNPAGYTEESFRKAKTGRTCGIIGLCVLGGIFFIAIVIGVLAAAMS